MIDTYDRFGGVVGVSYDVIVQIPIASCLTNQPWQRLCLVRHSSAKVLYVAFIRQNLNFFRDSEGSLVRA